MRHVITFFELIYVGYVFGVNLPIINVKETDYYSNRTDNLKVFRRERDSDANIDSDEAEFLPFILLTSREKDTSEYWRGTEILSLIRSSEADIDYEKCAKESADNSVLKIPSRRTVRPICRSGIDYQLCPQCPHFNNHTECELFRDSCKERKVHTSEYRTYCENKYGKYRALFIPADYSQCRCCDECVFYRELDQSCVQDEYVFDLDEFLPVTTIDFRAGCNPYWGHPEQELKALRCDKVLRRCVPVTVPPLPDETLNYRRTYRYEQPSSEECPLSCRGYDCFGGLVKEKDCPRGGFLPDKDQCNCCGRCSTYHQINQKCAEFKQTVHIVNGSQEIEIEEEFLEPGCDDGLVCRQGTCQDIHKVAINVDTRRKRQDDEPTPFEPCKTHLGLFKKKYGPDGHLHFEAPQCTPLWLYAPVQCRRFVCYCALEDGTIIEGIKVPRVEVSNMNCDCAREKCRMKSDIECDGFGNYKEARFTSDDEMTLKMNKARSIADVVKCGNKYYTYILGVSKPVTLQAVCEAFQYFYAVASAMITDELNCSSVIIIVTRWQCEHARNMDDLPTTTEIYLSA